MRARRPTLRDNRFTIASGKLSLWANWLRDAGSYWSESLMVLSPEGWYTLCRGRRPRSRGKQSPRGPEGRHTGMKKPGTAPDLLVRGWVPIEVQNLAVPGTGHARGLRLGGSPGSPAAFERSGCAVGFEWECWWSHQRYVRARRPTLRQEAAAASRAVTTLTPHPPAPASGRGGAAFLFLAR